MAQARIASRAPVACAGCYGQYPERVHIDFSSAIEGAAISDNPRAPRVDWVVMCSECIRRAFELLPEQVDARTNLTAQLEAALRRAEAAENYASKLEDTLQHRPQESVLREPRPQRPSRQGQQPRKRRQPVRPRAQAEPPSNHDLLNDAAPQPKAPAAPVERKNRYAGTAA